MTQTILVPLSWSDDLKAFTATLPDNIRLNSQWSSQTETDSEALGLCCESVQDLEALKGYKNIEVVSFAGTGISDVLEMPIVQGRSLTLCNIRDYASVDVAEHAVALMFGLAKKLIEGENLIRNGSWSTGDLWGLRLHGKKLGLLGLGSIGSEVARMARALGMEVLYWSRNRHADTENQLGISYVSFKQVFEYSDFVSLHLALNEETKGIVGQEEFRSMKHGSFLINTARGGLVEIEALIHSLRSGQLAGAGLDVFEEEPLPSTHELRGLQNVLLSPHVGAATTEGIRRSREECLLNVVSYLRGKPRNVVRAGS
jgi:phosphoglycerate dehydrogenase-like enzyme